MRLVQPRSDQAPPYKPPTPKDRLFYLLLTLGASAVVYKTARKNIRGLVTLCVGSFGLYHSLGCSWKCIKDIANTFFGGFGGPSSGGLGTCDPSSEWSDRYPQTPPSSSTTLTGGVDTTERQSKRHQGGSPLSSLSSQQDDFPTLTIVYQPTPTSYPSSSKSSTGATDQSERQSKRESETNNDWSRKTTKAQGWD